MQEEADKAAHRVTNGIQGTEAEGSFLLGVQEGRGCGRMQGAGSARLRAARNRAKTPSGRENLV